MPATLLTELRPLVRLAVPLALAQLVQAGMTFVDTVMVGRLGGHELAGMALGATVLMFAVVFLQGIIFAVGPTVAHAFGAGERQEAGTAARQGMWLAMLLAIPATVILLRAHPLLLAMGQDPESSALAAGYLAAAGWGIAPVLLLAALRAFLEGTGDTRPILLLMGVGLAANVVLDELLIFGRFGLPALGVAGAGYATTFVHAVMFLLAAAYVAWHHRGFAVFVGRGGPDAGRMWALLRLGTPIGLTLGFEAGLFSVTALLMGLVGTQELAAHQIAIQTATMTFTVAVGFAVATSVRVGQALGRGDEAAARIAGRTGILASIAVMAASATLFWLAPRAIIGIYLDTSDPVNFAVVGHAVTFLGIAATFQIFDGIQVSAAGSLRGYKDTTVPMFISLVSYWVVGLGSGACLAFVLGWGGRGLWTGLVLGLATAAGLLLVRFSWRSRSSDRRKGRMPAVLERRS